MLYLISNQTNAFDGVFEQITLEDGIRLLSNLTEIGLDTETSGLDCHTKRLLLLQLGNEEIQCVFDLSSYTTFPYKLKEFLNNSVALFIIQNAKFDLQFLYKQDIWLKNVYDTMLAETILTIGMQDFGRDLATLADKYCQVTLDKSVRGDIITKGVTSAVIQYAANDIAYLIPIMTKQLKYIKHLELSNAVNLDNQFVKVLAYIEFCGIKLDWDKWQEKSVKELDIVKDKLSKLNNWLKNNGYLEYFQTTLDLFSGEASCTLNWNSSSQVISLFEKIGINCTIKDKGADKKTAEEKVLNKYIKDFPILELYFDYKEAVKLTSTYGLSWKKMINSQTGRIHTSFKQLMNTGRLSSGNMKEGKPNLQNLPSDHLTRSCFIAEKDNKFIAADYSSQEQIVLANFSQESNLLNFYAKGFTDMHSYVAFLMYPNIRRCSVEELTPEGLAYIKKDYPEERKIAKSAGFAINYGGNGATIAKNCNISKADGDFVYESYFNAFPGLKNYFEYKMYTTESKGYILFNNVTNRKLFFKLDEPFIKYKDCIGDFSFTSDPDNRIFIREYYKNRAEVQRKSQNYPIQGSSADCSKLAGCIFFNELLKNNWINTVKIVNMVHDEFCVEAPEGISEEVSDLLVKSMIKAGSYFCKTVPLGAVSEIGDYWIH